MIHGATIRRPNPQRTIADATTRLASQKPTGRERAIAVVSARSRARVALAAKPHLVEEPRDLRGLLTLHSHLRRRLGHVSDDRVLHSLASGRLLQSGHVR